MSMAISMRDLDPAFQGAGQKAGMAIWRIENFTPVPVPQSSYGKFFTGDSYVILKVSLWFMEDTREKSSDKERYQRSDKTELLGDPQPGRIFPDFAARLSSMCLVDETTGSKSGALRHDVHYWLGEDTSQDEAGTAAIKTVELDAALGGRAVQYREAQGHETEKFLSYFKPCIMPQKGGVASGFKHPDAEEHETRLYVCKGKRVVQVKEANLDGVFYQVPFARSSLSHDDVFILDTKSKIFQFNGSNSSIQERAKALEVVQFIKDTYHDGKCEVASIEDGKLMADADTGEFWNLFGGFAPLPKRAAADDNRQHEAFPVKLLCIEKGKSEPMEFDSLGRELLDSNKCYLLDCGVEVFVWMGRNTSLDDRKSASKAAEELLHGPDRPKAHVVRSIEGFETVMFRLKFDSWPQTTAVTESEDGRGKVAALLKRQGLNVKGLVKADPEKEEPEPYIDCTGNLQVWHVNGQEKTLLPSSEQSKFYSGHCYMFQYTYAGEDKEEYLVGTWFGKHSVEEERTAAILLASKVVESLKLQAVQARIFEGMEPIQFFSIFQCFIMFKGGISSGYKSYLVEKELTDDTYLEDGIALFRVQGSGPENMQAIQVDPVASSLNSSYCYILQSGSTVYTWSRSLTTSEDQELVERQLDMIKPNVQSKPQKEGTESEQFWDLLGGKCEHSNHKIVKVTEGDPHLFSCTFLEGNLEVTEIFNFTQDDLMTEDIFILDCYSAIFVWIGQQVESKIRMQALIIAEKFLERDFLLENLSLETPVFIITEACEPPFFTRFFNWDTTKADMNGDSFQRKWAILKNGAPPKTNKPKRRAPASYGGRCGVPDKSQRTRSMSFSPDRVRKRGRSPAFSALAANFENANVRNLSTPPPAVAKLYPKSVTDSARVYRSATIAALTASFEQVQQKEFRHCTVAVVLKFECASEAPKSESDANNEELSDSMSGSFGSLTIKEDAMEGEAEDEERFPTFPYERLKVSSTDPVEKIDVTNREAYLSSEEFRQKFEMTKSDFYKLPKWKQDKLKMALELF
ncbi:villin-4-like protein [Cinnamomum micranthum f. kanehirae]|uniref:Villin-4-like protein n=1 Tax=Cinnamomum micranthum f. kanehirae TaxID=337451 RepID=A0A3S3MWS5_9MAGN|nr:villin-4-like protein [Cinnamomum micranthum f. kanehirae]